METNLPQVKKTATRHYLRVMAFAVSLLLALGAAYYLYVDGNKAEVVVTPHEEVSTTTTGFARSAPEVLKIPKLNLETGFETPLGLNEDKTIEVPDSYEKVGWYKYGATPGEKGTATILGHVDSFEGPAVFWPLGQLEAGDEIEITRADGTTAVFVVEKSERYSQSDFPTEKVYGMTDHPSLRLITCTGVYSHGSQRYSHNLVVYANLKETSPTQNVSTEI
jgi:sortase (surface protein transpeptidase)